MPNAPAGDADTNAWCPSGGENWGSAGDNTNLADYKSCLMATYVMNQVAVYGCPADTLPSANGPRIRAASMNGQMGYNVVTLDEASYNAGYTAFGKTHDLIGLPPAMAFIFCDESMFSMNDGYLEMGLTSPSYPDVPANYHGGRVNCFGFADSHAEVHKWLGPVMPYTPYSVGVSEQNPMGSPAPFNGGVVDTTLLDKDWVWLTNHTSVKL